MGRIRRIGIDIDEVKYPGKEVFYRYLNEKLGLNLDWNDNKYDFMELAEKLNMRNEELDELYFEHSKTDLFHDTPPIEGSVEGIESFFEKGIELYAITSRPLYLRDATLEYIEKYFPEKFKEVIFAGRDSLSREGISKKEAILENEINLMLDDQKGHARELGKIIPVILFSKPWNRFFEMKNVYRVGDLEKKDYGWPEAIKITKELDKSNP